MVQLPLHIILLRDPVFALAFRNLDGELRLFLRSRILFLVLYELFPREERHQKTAHIIFKIIS